MSGKIDRTIQYTTCGRNYINLQPIQKKYTAAQPKRMEHQTAEITAKPRNEGMDGIILAASDVYGGRVEIDRNKTLYITDRKEWRAWLEEHFETEEEAWLIYPKPASGKKRISWDDAVEEALCFGWIDSIHKRFDEESTAQRFSRRRKNSSFSQLNKERLKWLLERDMVHRSVKEIALQAVQERVVFPPDIIAALKNDPVVWEHYQNFSDSYKRIRIAYIANARTRPEEFSRRLSSFIRNTKKNRLLGLKGTEKYY